MCIIPKISVDISTHVCYNVYIKREEMNEMFEVFNGYTLGLEEAEKRGWVKVEEGCLAGKARWHWETWHSPDGLWTATFRNNTYTATVERCE